MHMSESEPSLGTKDGTSDRVSTSCAACVRLWRALQEKKPLVQCITNYVSMDVMANTLNAVGASPAMVRGSQGYSLPLHC